MKLDYKNKLQWREFDQYMNRGIVDDPIIRSEVEDCLEKFSPKRDSMDYDFFMTNDNHVLDSCAQTNYTLSSDLNYPRNVEQNYCLSLDPNIPRSAEQNYPLSLNLNIPRSVEQNYPLSSDPNFPRSAEQNYPLSSDLNVPRSAGQNYSLSSDFKFPKSLTPPGFDYKSSFVQERSQNFRSENEMDKVMDEKEEYGNLLIRQNFNTLQNLNQKLSTLISMSIIGAFNKWLMKINFSLKV